MNVILIHYFKSYEECTRLCRAVKITGIAEFSLIQIFLKTIEDVLHARIQLEFDVVVQHERIIQLQIEVEELGRILHAVQSSCPYKCRTVRSRNSSPEQMRK